MIRKRNKLVYGVGINDADYIVVVNEIVDFTDGKYKQKAVWRCPFYGRWTNMLLRCYSESYQLKYPTYTGCYVCEDWLTFSKFKSWMVTKDHEGKHLDKDILFPGNKVYSPDTCIFVDARVNTFMVECSSVQGEYPIGVDFHKGSGKFRARCQSVVTGKSEFLGRFSTQDEAHQAWLEFKLSQAHILVAEQTDERVIKALVAMYELYEVYKGQNK